MKTIRIFLPVAAVCALLVGGVPNSAVSKPGPTVVAVDDVGAAANQQLAAARQATAKYHDIFQALDDGYLPVSGCVVGEGTHHRKALLFNDCEFHPEQPEVLHYVLKPNGEFKLVGVEYLVKKSCPGLSTHPPEGFVGNSDVWISEINNTVWALNAWIWFGNPDGIFAPSHPRIDCN